MILTTIFMNNKRIILLITLLISFVGQSQQRTIFDIARNGTLEEVTLLYNSTPELINTVNERNSSPLLLACYKGNAEVALFLLERVKDINSNPGMGSPLMAAVMSGDMVIVQKLIQKNADLNQVDTQGKTALLYATFFNKTEIAKALISAGANKNSVGNDGKTALDYATFNKNTELIILLN